MSTPFADKPTLVGELVTLRPIRADDADTIDRLICEDDEIARLTGSVHRSTDRPEGMPPEDLRQIYGSWATADDRLVLGIVDNASGDLVGEGVLNEWDEGNKSCGFRTLIGRTGRGRGLGTEATRLIVRHGLGSMGLHRIAHEVYAFNPRAARLREGRVRSRGHRTRGAAVRRPVDRRALHGDPQQRGPVGVAASPLIADRVDPRRS